MNQVLALVSADREQSEVNELREAVKQRLLQTTGSDFNVVDSVSWFRQNFDKCGSWDSWVWDAVLGLDYGTRKPRFAAFIVCEDVLGKANANIAQLALRSSKPLFRWKGQQEPLTPATTVQEATPGEWRVQ